MKYARFLALILLAAALAAADEGSCSVFDDHELLNDGLDHYKRGQFSDACAKFEQALQRQLSSDLIYAFIKREGADVVAGLLTAPDEGLRAVGYRLFEISK